MADAFFDLTHASGASLAAMSVAAATVQKLHVKGLLSTAEVNEIFEAALSSLERLDVANSPDVRLARALVDAQAQGIVTGRIPKPPTP